MKRNILLVCFAGMGLWLAQAQPAEPLDLNQLPSVVQRTINDVRGAANVVSVQRVYRFGTPVYEVRLAPPGPADPVYVTDAGTVVKPGETVAIAPARSREVMFNDLPVAVQNAIRAQAGDNGAGTVEAISANGRTTYEVPVRLTDRRLTFWFDPAGNILAVSPPRMLLSGVTRVVPADLPGPVQDTLRTLANGAPVGNIQKGTYQGQTYYDVAVPLAGRYTDLRLAQDGTLVRDTVNDRYLAETGSLVLPGTAPLVANITPAAPAPPRAPFLDPMSVSFNQLPLPVLTTVQNYAGHDLVERIERGTSLGQTVYEATLRHAGQLIPLRVREDGSLVNDVVNNDFMRSLQSQPAVAVTRDWRAAPARLPLYDATALRVDQLPRGVRDGLRFYAGGSRVSNITQGTVNGRTYYEATVDLGNELNTLRFNEDGLLVADQPDEMFLSRFGPTLGIGTPVGVGTPASISTGTGYSQ